MSVLEPVVDVVLVPSGTILAQKGDSPAVEIHADNRVFLLTLKITEAIEQEYIELWLQGSADGTTWATTPLATLPQHFYTGEYPTLIDLSADKATKFVRVHWEVLRWGRSELTPRFVCGITFKQVPPDLLRLSS
ncbi:hypothetical protein Acid345_3616 [Candidatus Koribacter versatilis Ellin345]|uniref:Uncharacterized protein n=1 Tax=Koribacter versatilis (strain Ellin345) TaxID=204669 RepID=Q1IKI3_KORVE|nr:hypothetical protein [Candidatus Koribacter versatilis]ABF42617.1 hypothetical protein Acid345_3616 [Candidatus Koribacter versatilis Ellin345]